MEIFEARKKHKNIFVTDFPTGNVVWRPLGWDDYKIYRDLCLQAPHLTAEVEERVFEECVLEVSPSLEKAEKAGIITTVAYQIIQVSGIVDPMSGLAQLEVWRNEVRRLDEQMILLVCKAFGYKPEEVERLEYQEFLRRVAMAETMMGAHISPAAPEEEETPIDFEKEAKELVKQVPQANLQQQYANQTG